MWGTFRASCSQDIAEIGRGEADQIAAGLAARSWPPDAARLPWVISAYPGEGHQMTAKSAEDLVGRLYGVLILVEDRLGPSECEKRTTSSKWTITPWHWTR